MPLNDNFYRLRPSMRRLLYTLTLCPTSC